MNIAIRVDASSQIGTGHFIRCLTLADTLKIRGAQIRFISRHLPEYLQGMLVERGYGFNILKSGDNEADDLTHSHWLGVSQRSDAQDSINALSDQMWDWLIVDHYGLDARWESELRNTAKNILVVDDIADRKHECDILLDLNYYEDMRKRYIGKVSDNCRLLLGPRYALLRDDFRQLRETIEPRTGPVERVLVFFGGVDTDNYTEITIDVLNEMDISDLDVDVVIGAQHPFSGKIIKLCEQHGFNCHVQTDRMAELMANADLAIGAGGSAIWERCCLGLPTLVFSTADNQQKQTNDAAQECIIYAPTFNRCYSDAVRTHLLAFLENDPLRHHISHRAMQFADGKGVLRVVNHMTQKPIEMRLANEEDSTSVFNWRNNKEIRSVSRNADPIAWKDHQKWFSDVLNSKDRPLLIGHIEKNPVGVVRFDIQGDIAEVSIYLVPDANQSGLGRNLLDTAEQWIKKNRPETQYIKATVLDGNEPSKYLFSGAHYHTESTDYVKKLS